MTLEPVSAPAAWLPSELVANPSWRFELEAFEVAHLVDVVSGLEPVLRGDANNLLKLCAEDFPLGSAAPKIAALRSSLANGVGVVLLGGLPVESLDTLTIATIYWGIGLHLGTPQPNNPEGDVLGHVTDLGKSRQDPTSRGYQTRELMDYHCDQSAIVGLMCVRTAKSGGVSRITSSLSMYNTLLERYPHYAQVLSEPMHWTKHGEMAVGAHPWYDSPVFNFDEGRLSVAFGPIHIIKGHNLPGSEPLPEINLEALRAAEKIADEQAISMEFRPGDMQFLNNFTMLHTRTAYVDWLEPERKRLLWRLWLANDELRTGTSYSGQWRKGVQVGASAERVVL